MNNEASHRAARQLGTYIKTHRKEQGYSVRELAHRAGIDAGGLTRIEQGKRIHSPRPVILNRLAHALNVPITELLTCVGYQTPPNLGAFLHDRYSHLPEEVIAEATAYIERLVADYGVDPNGVVDHEDESGPSMRLIQSSTSRRHHRRSTTNLPAPE